jgi:hypothetical protein
MPRRLNEKAVVDIATGVATTHLARANFTSVFTSTIISPTSHEALQGCYKQGGED